MHPTEADILLYLEDKLTSVRTEEMKYHFSTCDRCRKQVVVLLRLPSVAESDGIPLLDPTTYAKARQLGSPRRFMRFFLDPSPYGKLAIAALVVVIIGTTSLYLGRSSAPSRFRDLEPAPYTFSLSPSEGATVQRLPALFHWSGVKNAVGYQIALYRENGLPMWQGTSNDTSFLLPAGIVLQPGKTYLWKVEGFLPDRTTYESKLNAFVYSP